MPRNERPIASQALGRIVIEVPKEVLAQALLSDAVAVRAGPNSAVEGRN
jgi:hypothetical protein